MTDDLDVFIAVPCYGDMPVEVVKALLGINRQLPFPSEINLLGGCSLIPCARNILAGSFLRGKCTHLLFLDADIVFQPADIIRLLSHDEALVSGVYTLKQPKLHFCVGDVIEHDRTRDLMEVRHTGAGFLAIRRDVFEKMIEAFGAEIEFITQGPGACKQHDFFRAGIYRDRNGQSDYRGEDWFFCEKARELGFKVYVDLRVLLKHIGRAFYPLDEAPAMEAGIEKSAWTVSDLVNAA